MTASPSSHVDPFVAPASIVAGGPLYVAEQLHVKPGACIVVEDSPVGAAACVAAGMTAIGFAGSHAGSQLGLQLRSAGARTVISDLRAVKSAIIDLCGW